MLPIHNFYTGQGAGTEIPELGKTEAAVSKYQEGQQRLYEIKYQDAIRKREELLKVGAMDIADIFNEKLQEEQSDMIDKFQSDIQKKYEQYKGDIPTNVMLDIQKQRNVIESWQKGKMATQEAFLKDLGMYRTKPYDFNPDVADKVIENYYNTGTYKQGDMFSPAPINTEQFFLKMAGDKDFGLTKVESSKTTQLSPGVYDTQKTWAYSADKNEVWDFTKNLVLSNRLYRDNMSAKFLKLPPKEQERYIADAEKSVEQDNAVMRFAFDEAWNAVQRNRKESESVTQTKDYSKMFGVWFGNSWRINDEEVLFKSPKLSSSVYLKDKAGLVVNANAVKTPVQISSDVIVDKPNGLMLPNRVNVIPSYISKDMVEFSVAQDGSMRQYDVDADGNKVVYPYSQNKSKSMSTSDIKYEFDRQKSMETGSPVSYKYSLPKTINITTMLDDVRISMSKDFGQGWESYLDELKKAVSPGKSAYQRALENAGITK